MAATATRTARPTAPLTPAADTATRLQAATARYVALTADGDYDGCLAVCDEMTMCHRQLALVGDTDLIRVA